jgi:hypothetical protein
MMVLHPFLHMGGRRAQLGHPVNHINYQIKAVNLVEIASSRGVLMLPSSL